MTESRTPLPTAYKDRTRLSSAPTVRIIPSFQRPQNKPKLLDLLREELRSRHYSRRTEAAYCSCVKRFIYFHNVRHPAEMAEGRGRVQLPDALDRKYPNAPTDWHEFWLGGKPQCFDPNKDYSSYSQKEIILPVACGDHAKALTSKTKKKD